MTTSDQRQTYSDHEAWDRPVQASRYTEGRGKSSTETARIVAHHHGWRFNGDDAVTEDRGPLIAWTIEDAAAAMEALGWISLSGVHWGEIPNDSESVAAAVRSLVDEGGRFPGRALD